MTESLLLMTCAKSLSSHTTSSHYVPILENTEPGPPLGSSLLQLWDIAAIVNISALFRGAPIGLIGG